jgi:hypothetical protein
MSVTWITPDDVEEFLGVVDDDAFLASATAAANEWAYRRRSKAGYDDDPTVVPGADVRLGTAFYAAALYRERGSADSFPSFEEFSTGVVPQSTFGQVLRLLGLNRPMVDGYRVTP